MYIYIYLYKLALAGQTAEPNWLNRLRESFDTTGIVTTSYSKFEINF